MCFNKEMFHFLYLLFKISIVYSSQFNPEPFLNVVEKTTTIVNGKTGKSYSDWVVTPSGEKQLFTFTELFIKEVLKGKTEHKKILIREIGGEKDGMIFDISGTVKFHPNEEVVVLLGNAQTESEDNETFSIQNMSLGKLMIETKSDGSEVLKGPALVGEPPSGNKEWRVDDVKKLIENPRPLETPKTFQYSMKPQTVLHPLPNPIQNQPLKNANSEREVESKKNDLELQKKENGISKFLKIGFGILLILWILKTYLKNSNKKS